MAIKGPEIMAQNNIGRQGVRRGVMIWVGGQADLEDQIEALNPFDLPRQITGAMRRFDLVLHDLNVDLRDLVFLLCFYLEDGNSNEEAVLDLLAAALPSGVRTAITVVPVPSLRHQGQMVEVEGYAMRQENGDRMSRTYVRSSTSSTSASKFCAGIRCGKMIFVSGQSPVDPHGGVHAPGDIIAQTNYEMEEIRNILAQFGAGFEDVVKNNRWYSGRACVEDFEPAALACASFYNDPGPAATGIPVPRFSDPDVMIKLSCVAMLGEDGETLPRQYVWPESLWDWTISLPYKHGVKCEDMIFLGGQVSLNKKGEAIDVRNLPAQVRRSIGHIRILLRALGADEEDLYKLTTLYRRDDTADATSPVSPDQIANSPLSGPVNTQVPLPDLAYPGLEVEIEAFAMSASSETSNAI